MEALCCLQFVCAARLRPFSMRGQVPVVKFHRLLSDARTRGAIMDDLGQASSSVVPVCCVVGSTQRAKLSRPIPHSVFRGFRGRFLVATSLNCVLRHGKTLAIRRHQQRSTRRPFSKLRTDGSILPIALRASHTHLDGRNFAAQSKLIESRRGTHATSFRAIARRISRPSRRPPDLMRFPAIRRLSVLTGGRMVRAPPALFARR
jgi:hypothetical protein